VNQSQATYLVGLERLEVLQPQLDAGDWLGYAVQVPSLREIKLYKKRLPDDELLRLLTKLPRLTKLDLEDTQTSPEAIKEFAAKVPWCRITTRKNPTGDDKTMTIEPTAAVAGATNAGTPIAAAPFGVGFTGSASPTVRWPLPPSKPDDMRKLLAAKAEIALRSSPLGDNKVKLVEQLPTGPATIVGVTFNGDGATVNDAILAVIAGLTDLEELAFGKAKFEVTSVGLFKLASLTHLRRLNVNGLGSYAAAVVDIVKSMPELEYIHLPYGPSDQWARVVATRLGIVEVSTYRSGFSDEGLRYLETMTHLRRIDLRDSGISEAAVDRFAAAVPGCRIVYKVNGKESMMEPRTTATDGTKKPSSP
jgi:hypothetical protein